MTEKQSRQLDIILRKLTKSGVRKYSIEKMQQQLFPDESIECCSALFHMLKEYYPPLLYTESGQAEKLFWATDYVKAFLSEGGFSKIFEKSLYNYIKDLLNQGLSNY